MTQPTSSYTTTRPLAAAERVQPDPVPGPSSGSNGVRTVELDDAATDARWLLNEFATAVGQELQVPLTIMQTAAATAVRHHDSLDQPAMARLLETIRRHSDLALVLAKRIDLANDIRNDALVIVRETVDLVRLVNESVAALDHTVLEGRPVRVTGDESLVVSADPAALREVVWNLVGDAAKHSPPEAVVEVVIRRSPENGAETTFRNRGAVTADVESMFDWFPQGSRNLPRGGLGLYVSQGIARAHGGSLRLQPGRPRGTELILTLPL